MTTLTTDCTDILVDLEMQNFGDPIAVDNDDAEEKVEPAESLVGHIELSDIMVRHGENCEHEHLAVSETDSDDGNGDEDENPIWTTSNNETDPEGRSLLQHSLPEVNASIEVDNGTNVPWWRTMFSYFGPGALVAVGYMDPGDASQAFLYMTAPYHCFPL